MDDLFHVCATIVLLTLIGITGYNIRQGDNDEFELTSRMGSYGCSEEVVNTPGGYTHIVWKCPPKLECR